MRSVVGFLVLVFVIPSIGVGRAAAQSEVTLDATEVTLDVVARDRRGRVIADLQPSDITILEDGVPQEVTSFRFVRPEPIAPVAAATSAAATATAAKPAPSEARSLTTAPDDTKAIAIVFDSLTPAARATAYESAMKYVENQLRPGDAVGVFAVDIALATVLPYTTDRNAILAGIEAAGERAGATFAYQRKRIERLQGGVRGVPSTDVTSDYTPLGSTPAQRTGDAELRQMALRSERGFEQLSRIQAGYATTNALLAVVEGLSLLPGRKAMLVFSEGISITDETNRRFESVISSANEARVSIYTVDAAGLRIASPNSSVASVLNGYGDQRMAELGMPGEGAGGPMLRGFEAVETALKSSPEAGLARLARETGGVFVSDTNGIAGRLRRVDDDLRTYYLVTYVPKNTTYDGAFRRVAVTSRRSGVKLRTREGYYAINVANAPPVLPYEAPAVAAATARTPRTEFPVRAIATSFPEPGRPGLAPVLVSVPASAATFMPNAKSKSFSTAFSVVALARDTNGRIVGKSSKEYVLTGPLDQVESAKGGDLLTYLELELDPGRYVVDVAAYDAPSKRASVRRLPLVVPEVTGDAPTLSSVTIVERAENVSGTTPVAAEPFRVGDALLYPNLGTPVRRTVGGTLAFYLMAYVAEGTPRAPSARVEIAQNGVTLKAFPVELPAPDAHGRIQYTNAFSLDPFGPGTYELRVTLDEAGHTATRSARFTVAS